jgi:hypothetical protein
MVIDCHELDAWQVKCWSNCLARHVARSRPLPDLILVGLQELGFVSNAQSQDNLIGQLVKCLREDLESLYRSDNEHLWCSNLCFVPLCPSEEHAKRPVSGEGAQATAFNLSEFSAVGSILFANSAFLDTGMFQSTS